MVDVVPLPLDTVGEMTGQHQMGATQVSSTLQSHPLAYGPGKEATSFYHATDLPVEEHFGEEMKS